MPMPKTVKSQGNTLAVILTTPPADAATGIPTLTEVNAGLFATCYYYGSYDLTPSENTGEGPLKGCQKVAETKFGNSNYPAVDIQGSYDPQALGTAGAPGNELYEALEPYSQHTVAFFPGIDGEAETVPADAVGDVFLMEFGRRRKGRTGEGEFDELSFTSSSRVVGGQPLAEDHVFPAGV